MGERLHPTATFRAVATRSSPGGLERRLTGTDATLLMIGSVVGGGIFLTPGVIAQNLPSARWILAAWLLGGLFTIAGGLVYAELGAMMPETGGTYVYLREAYGPLFGFLYAWTYFFVYNAGGVAALATGFATYAGVFAPSIGMGHALGTFAGIPISAGQLLAVAAVLALTATHYIGVKEGVRVQAFFTVLILITMGVLIVAGGLAPSPTLTSPAPQHSLPITAPAFGLAMVAVLWTYDGWNQIAAIAGEVKTPRRNIPIALVGGAGIVTLFYVGVNAIYLKAIPVSELAGVSRVAEVTTLRLLGPVAALIASGAILASGFGCTSANIAPGPRVAYALAKDGLFPAPFGRVNPRFQTPGFGLVVQAVWTSLLCLSGRYDQLYTYSIFVGILAFTATGIALFVFRSKRPDAERPYRCWGYPVVPAIYVTGSVLFLANTLMKQPVESFSGLAILLAGVPAFYFMRRRVSQR